MLNVMTKVKSFLLFLFLACLLKVGFVQVILLELKLGSSKLNEFAAVFDFFSEQALPNRVTSFHKENKLSPVDQVKGHIACGSVCCSSISKQYRRKVYYSLSFHFQECVFDRSVTSLNHSVSFGIIS